MQLTFEVHENYKGREEYRIGKNLFKKLDSADFLKGHIIERSPSDEDGFEFFSKKIDKYLTAKNYALVPYDARISSKNIPTKSGRYNMKGELIT